MQMVEVQDNLGVEEEVAVRIQKLPMSRSLRVQRSRLQLERQASLLALGGIRTSAMPLPTARALPVPRYKLAQKVAAVVLVLLVEPAARQRQVSARLKIQEATEVLPPTTQEVVGEERLAPMVQVVMVQDLHPETLVAREVEEEVAEQPVLLEVRTTEDQAATIVEAQEVAPGVRLEVAMV